MTTEDKWKLYETIEEKVAVEMGNKDWGYLVQTQNISWGDIPVFNIGTGRISISLDSHETDFSHLLDKKYNNDEIAQKASEDVIAYVQKLIERQIELCNFTGKIQDFKGSVKLALEGVCICADDKVRFKVGAGIVAVV